jgi:cytochrome P450
MVDAKQHATRRKLFAQSFSNSSILKFEAPVRDKINLAASKIERDARSGTADVLKWWTFMATDVSGQLSFGRSFDMLHLEQVSILSCTACNADTPCRKPNTSEIWRQHR